MHNIWEHSASNALAGFLAQVCSRTRKHLRTEVSISYWNSVWRALLLGRLCVHINSHLWFFVKQWSFHKCTCSFYDLTFVSETCQMQCLAVASPCTVCSLGLGPTWLKQFLPRQRHGDGLVFMSWKYKREWLGVTRRGPRAAWNNQSLLLEHLDAHGTQFWREARAWALRAHCILLSMEEKTLIKESSIWSCPASTNSTSDSFDETFKISNATSTVISRCLGNEPTWQS